MEPLNIEKRLTAIGDIIARVLDPNHTESGLEVARVKSSETATTLKATLGDKIGMLKLYHDGSAAADAFSRECKALELLNGSQVPQILFVAKSERVILTSFIKGKSLVGTLSKESVHRTAEHMGQWFGRSSNNTPTAVHHGNWADYLARYPAGFETEVLDQQRPLLEQTQINKIMLAHNDNALQNFIIGDDKRLYAVDFEDSRMKPEGWDLVTAGRALFGQMPEELQVISGSLLRGYQLTAKDSGLPNNFDQVISAVAFSNAVSAK